MTFIARHRKIILVAAILLVAGSGFWIGANTVHAATPPAAVAAAGSGLLNFAGSIADKISNGLIGVGMLYALLYFLSGLLHILLNFAAGLLSWFYTINMGMLPSNMLVVQQGWTVLRDLINGLFILIIIWIAFTIIFNLEGLGGKKLLVRVIIIALLMNFSLTLVTAVFGFTNALARPFARPLGLDPYAPPDTELKGGIGGYIINNSRIQTIDEAVSASGITNYNTYADQENAKTKGSIATIASIGAGVAASGGCYYLTAQFTGPFALALSKVCLEAGVGAAYLVSSLAGAKNPIQAAISLLINLAVGDIFLGLLTVSLLAAAILLLMRLVAMTFIGVFAPVAFAAYMMPARYGEKLWGMWLDNLFRWAFVLPIFYFLLYLSLYMLQVSATAQAYVTPITFIPFQANTAYIFSLVVFLVFLWASIFLTRKAAGMGAEAALSLGKKFAGFGLGVATGGLAFGAASLARRGAPALQKVLASPVLRGTTLARRTGAYLERQKERMAPHETELKDFGTDYLVQEFDRSIRAERKVAIANLLAKRGKFGELSSEKQTRALDLAGQFGPQSVENLLKARPDLANASRVSATDVDKQLVKMGYTGLGFETPEKRATIDQAIKDKAARRAILSKIKTSEAGDISDEAFEGLETIKEMWEVFSPAHIAKIAAEKPAMLAEMKKVLDTAPDVEMTPEMYRYLGSTTANAVGLSLPTNIGRPRTAVQQEIVEEERKIADQRRRIVELDEEADVLKSRGRQQEADQKLANARDIMETQIPIIEQKINRLKAEMAILDQRAKQRMQQQSATPGTSGGAPSSTAPNPLPPRGQMKPADVPPSWIRNTRDLVQQGAGSPEQRIILSANIPEPEKERRLREELADGYNKGNY